MAPSTLRSLLPLSIAEIASVSALVAELVARLHERGVVHGSIGIDDVLVNRSESGAFEVGLTAPTGRGAQCDDVAALGSMINAALAMSRGYATTDPGATRALADIAASARGAALNGGTSAGDVREALSSAAGRDLNAHGRDRPRTPGRWAARLWLSAWIALLVATVAWLPRVAAEVSPPPLLEGSDAVSNWFADRDAARAFAGVLRMAVHGIAVYLLASTVVACGIQLIPSRAAHRISLLDRLTLAPVRRVVHTAFGIGMTLGALASLAPGEGVASAARPPQVAVPTPPVATAPPVTVAAPLPPPRPQAAPASLPETWTVRPGDDFWNIAQRLLSNALERPVTDAEIDPYWRLLVETNRDRLVDPGNADLLFEGQRLGVPPLPVPPETPAT